MSCKCKKGDKRGKTSHECCPFEFNKWYPMRHSITVHRQHPGKFRVPNSDLMSRGTGGYPRLDFNAEASEPSANYYWYQSGRDPRINEINEKIRNVKKAIGDTKAELHGPSKEEDEMLRDNLDLLNEHLEELQRQHAKINSEPGNKPRQDLVKQLKKEDKERGIGDLTTDITMPVGSVTVIPPYDEGEMGDAESLTSEAEGISPPLSYQSGGQGTMRVVQQGRRWGDRGVGVHSTTAPEEPL